jgi:hypothetical protein
MTDRAAIATDATYRRSSTQVYPLSERLPNSACTLVGKVAFWLGKHLQNCISSRIALIYLQKTIYIEMETAGLFRRIDLSQG